MASCSETEQIGNERQIPAHFDQVQISSHTIPILYNLAKLYGKGSKV